ncbi:MAG: hypothetical protein GC164_06025 [Phycisphaera sp.]|nr:hypothetical protein [Phycisphaera sp.]
MKRPWLNPKRTLVFAVGVLCVTSLLPANLSQSIARIPRTIVYFPVTPVADLLHRVASPIFKSADLRIDTGGQQQLERNYTDNLAYSRKLEAQLEAAAQEILRLRQVREFQSLSKLSFVPANVISGPDLLSPRLTINKGARHGLRENLVVVYGSTLVGRISTVETNTATVALITSPRTRLDARVVPPTPGQAPVEMNTQLAISHDRSAFTSIIDATANVAQVGDLAHLHDGLWPPEAQGLIVGKVTAVSKNPDNPTLEDRIVVQPLYALPYLTRVDVLVPAGEVH